MWVANLGVVERSEAEAIYDSGRDRCVEFILELARGFEQLSAANARLGERVRRLEEQSRADSRTSSAPPSCDPPKTRQQRRAEARVKAKELLGKDGGRKAGGQPGHEGKGRKLLSEDRMQEIFDHYPDACDGCGHEFVEGEKVPCRRPGRHQVAELPPIAVVYFEHRTHRLRCPDCHRRSRATLPVEVAGPRL